MRASAAVLAVALVVASPSLHAQSLDPAAATELFKQGRAAMELGDYKAACPKFAESLRLDAKVGTLLNLAECEEKLGQLASARQHLQRAIDQARIEKDDRIEIARQRYAAIDARVPRLSISLAVGSPIGTVVKRDDVELAGASLDTPLPVDPGEHVIIVTAVGYAPKTFPVTLAEGEQQIVAVGPGALLPKPEPKVDVAAPVAVGPRPPPDTDDSRGSSTRTWGYVVGSVGLVGLGVGTAFGLIALSKNSASKDNGACDANNVCDATGKSARDAAHSAGNVSTFAFIGGGIAVAVGAVLILTAPSPTSPRTARIEVAPLVGASSGGLFVRAGW